MMLYKMYGVTNIADIIDYCNIQQQNSSYLRYEEMLSALLMSQITRILII